MMLSNEQIQNLARKEKARAGEPWQAYEQAKRRVVSLLGEDCDPRTYNAAVRQIAAVLNV